MTKVPVHSSSPRRVCFVTGTRAEFGLMRKTLAAIAAHPKLRLQILATGMHLSAAHGTSVRQIASAGFAVDATVAWKGSATAADNAAATGAAMAGIARALSRLRSETVLVVGDRVEAFAGAAAGQIGGLVVAHVHGGDRALGQSDDSLRHAITKLAHLHFPATATSEQRILKLGEDGRFVYRVGSPGIDGIAAEAATFGSLVERFPGLERRRFALVVLHPTIADEGAEYERAAQLLAATRRAGLTQILVVYPNNDPGYGGIVRCWDRADAMVCRDLPRPLFLAAMRDAAVLVGNSSSGVIEAASFGTPVVDVGDRQAGREHGENLRHVDWDRKKIERRVAEMCGRRFARSNLYGGGSTAVKIATVLATAKLTSEMRRKLIRY